MRSLWKGSLNFGLVNIPVEMFVASRDREIKFVLLHDKDYSQVRYARMCKEEEKEITWDHIVKGYETAKGKFVTFSEEELKKATLQRTEIIDITQFADEAEVDAIFFDKPYVLKPQKGAAKAYALLVEALRKSKKVGIAKYVLHNRGHIGVVRPFENIILVNQLRYQNELVDFDEFKIPTTKRASAMELNMALKLIEHLTASFKPTAFKDTYVEELKKIIRQKEKGKKIHVSPVSHEPTAKIYDLMSLLKASLDKKEKTKPKAKRRTAA